jgi:hypothetical protein
MGTGPADFYAEIIPGRPQGKDGLQWINVGGVDLQFLLSPDTPAIPVDVTKRIIRGGVGSINRAVERDLTSFKTGDMTLSLLNFDGFFDDLFAFFTPTTMWYFRLFRRGAIQFAGVIIGLGSVSFNRKEKTVDMTVYGLTKLLDMTDAMLVRRGFYAANQINADAPAGSATLTLISTANMLTGDILHLTDQVNKEDVTIKQVTSGTVVSLEAVTSNHYVVGSDVTVTTPFDRYKSVSYLVTQLFQAAFIGMADLRLSNSTFNRLAPSPVSLEGTLSLANDARRGMTETLPTGSGLNHIMVGVHGVDDFTQGDPDTAWITQGLSDRGPYDWSPYYTQGSSGPAFLLYEPVVGVTQETATEKLATYWGAADYADSGGGTRRLWGISYAPPGLFGSLRQRTTLDGVTYAASTDIPFPADRDHSIAEAGCEWDPVRGFVYTSWKGRLNANRYFRYRDIAGAAWVDCKQVGDINSTGYYGPRYIADLDYTLVLRNDTISSTGPFTICAFRGTTMLWSRPFPSCLIAQDVAGNPYFYPTRNARYIDGRIYMTLVSDGAVQLLRTDDEFLTYTMRELVPSTTKTILMGARVRSTYRIFSYVGTSPHGYFIAAPFYAGVIPYADFDGLSAAEGLKKLALLTNSLFWVDDDLQGHFVARDLYDSGQVTYYPRLMREQSDVLLWDQAAQYAKVTGNSISATAGVAAFAAQGVEIESSFIPNEAYAQSLADAIYAYYSVARKFVQGSAHDIDGRIFYPMDRITLGGPERYLVYESDHSLTDDSVALQLLEDR